MDDIQFLIGLKQENAKGDSEVVAQKATPPLNVTTLQDSPAQVPSGNVIKQRVLFSMTVINVYPNGAWFIDRQQSKQWFKDQDIIIKKKEKKKAEPVKKLTTNQDEVY
jgi:hypothetical protein